METNQIIDGNKTPPERIPAGRSKYHCGRYDEVKRRHKDREISAIGEIPYFFLLCVGFSRYPDAYAARPCASACAFVG